MEARPARVAVLVMAVLLAAPATAAARASLDVADRSIELGDRLEVSGRGWEPVNDEDCTGVTLTLRSAQNAFRIGAKRPNARGRFSYSWTASERKVGAGSWRLEAAQRCEGRGAVEVTRRSLSVRLR
jgi:hypothetical protein